LFLIITTTYQGLHSLSATSSLNSLALSANQLNRLSHSANSVMETISVMNILAHMNIRSSAIAAQTIQRAWKSTSTFTTRLRTEARENASQLGYQPFGRDSLRGDYDFLNQIHDFWRPTGTSAYRLHKKISFAEECSVRTEVDGTSPTDFYDTPDKSSRLFANTIVALFGGKVPLYKLFSHRNAPAMEPYFKDAICKLEAGQKVSIWDGQSTKLQATDKALVAVKECFVKYNYFMKSFGQPVQWATKVAKTEEPLVCTMKPLKPMKNKVLAKPMGLARVAPRKVAGVKMIDQGPSVDTVPTNIGYTKFGEFSVEDLEERLQKMMNLSYS